MENKMNLKKDVEQQLDIANEKHKQQIMEKIMSQNEHMQLNNERALKEIMKEESYKRVIKLKIF